MSGEIVMDQWEACKALCIHMGSDEPEMDAYKVQVFMNEMMNNDESPKMALAMAKQAWVNKGVDDGRLELSTDDQ